MGQKVLKVDIDNHITINKNNLVKQQNELEQLLSQSSKAKNSFELQQNQLKENQIKNNISKINRKLDKLNFLRMSIDIEKSYLLDRFLKYINS